MAEAQQLKEVGLKITAPRVKILQILRQSRGHHLSAEDIYNTLLNLNEDVGLATVYRVLTQFESAGLIIRHHFETDHSVFELSEGEHHDHLVCIECGEVQEFVDVLIEQRQKIVAQQANFKMTDHALNIYGICLRCVGKNEER